MVDKKPAIKKAQVKRIMKGASNAKLIAADAEAYLQQVTGEQIDEIIKNARSYRDAAKRETLQEEDVMRAVKNACSQLGLIPSSTKPKKKVQMAPFDAVIRASGVKRVSAAAAAVLANYAIDFMEKISGDAIKLTKNAKREKISREDVHTALQIHKLA